MSSLAPVGFCVVSLYSVELNTLRSYPRLPYIARSCHFLSQIYFQQFMECFCLLYQPCGTTFLERSALDILINTQDFTLCIET